MTDQYDQLAPGDAAVALRSLPRRYTSALATFGDERPDEVLDQLGPDGHSALDHTVHVARSLALLHRALDEVLQRDDPVLLGAVADDGQRGWDSPPAITRGDALAQLAGEAEPFADRVDATHGDLWTRTARLAGGGATSALALVQEGVRTGVEHLRAVERTLEVIRRSR